MGSLGEMQREAFHATSFPADRKETGRIPNDTLGPWTGGRNYKGDETSQNLVTSFRKTSCVPNLGSSVRGIQHAVCPSENR